MGLRRFWNHRRLAGLCAAAVLALTAVAHAQMSYLDNGVIRIGANLGMGGSITYLSTSGSSLNVINSADLGRQVQQSYYSGPDNYDPLNNQHPNWSPWPWNPIQSGDCYNFRSTVLEHSNDGSEIYVKARPMQWALRNVPGEATFESWIRLDGTSARIRARLNNARTDTTEMFSARHQELPAVYTVGTLHRLFTYEGTAPWTNGTLTNKGYVPPPWTYWRATENWAALVNNSDWGLGVYTPGAGLFIGGFYGTPGSGGPSNSQTGYISPLHTDHIDHNIVYEYEYALILGSLNDIRAWVYQQPRSSGPTYRFLSDRRHWHCQNGFDSGVPDGFLRVPLDSTRPRLIGPPCAFLAADVPTLYVRAAYHTASSRVGEVYWELNNEGVTGGVFRTSQRVTFAAAADGKFRTYAVPLSTSPNYTGLITQLRFDPGNTGPANDHVRIQYISANRLPEIELSVETIQRSAAHGGSLPDDSFTVRNAGSGTVSYTIASDAGWVSVTPAEGTSTSEADTISVKYALAGLALGSHTATLTVSDPSAVNSPQTLTINLQIVESPAMRADRDHDGDVDLDDFGWFQTCYSALAEPVQPNCQAADLNDDGTVDGTDFTIFRACLSGANKPVDPDCGR